MPGESFTRECPNDTKIVLVHRPRELVSWVNEIDSQKHRCLCSQTPRELVSSVNEIDSQKHRCLCSQTPASSLVGE